MGRKVFGKKQILLYALTAGLIYGEFRIEALKQPGPFSFYKNSYVWPTSFCNREENLCEKPFFHDFTVHGSWPMEASGQQLLSYNYNPGCVDVEPTPVEEITETLLHPILDGMKTYWPDLKDPRNQTANLWFWRSQWLIHGMCSGYPNRPIEYFTRALDSLLNTYNLLRILHEGGVFPDRSYSAERIISSLAGSIKRVQIHCNRDSLGTQQLFEIRVCFNNLYIQRGCPRKQFSGCNLTENIRFPCAN